jgi:hypothetical protein
LYGFCFPSFTLIYDLSSNSGTIAGQQLGLWLFFYTFCEEIFENPDATMALINVE